MTMINPPVEESLEHAGVKGMKWGVRKERGSDGRAPNPGNRKPTSQEILAARVRQNARLRKTEEAHAEFIVARGKKTTARAEKVFLRRMSELNNNPDRKTSELMTKGEKIAAGISLGVAGLSMATVMGMAIYADSRRF